MLCGLFFLQHCFSNRPVSFTLCNSNQQFMYIYLLGMCTFSRSLSQNKALQGDTRPDLFFSFCDNDWLNAHYPLHKQWLPYGIYAASFAQRLLCTTKKVTLRGGWKGHGPRVSLRNYRHSNLLPLPALMTETELPSWLSCLSSVHQHSEEWEREDEREGEETCISCRERRPLERGFVRSFAASGVWRGG